MGVCRKGGSDGCRHSAFSARHGTAKASVGLERGSKSRRVLCGVDTIPCGTQVTLSDMWLRGGFDKHVSRFSGCL